MTDENLPEKQQVANQPDAEAAQAGAVAAAVEETPEPAAPDEEASATPESIPADEMKSQGAVDDAVEQQMLEEMAASAVPEGKSEEPDEAEKEAERQMLAELAKLEAGEGEGEDAPHVISDLPGAAGADLPTVKPVEFGDLNRTPASGKGRNIDILMEVRLPIAIELGRTQMTVHDILDLAPGSVVELNKLAGEPVDLLVNNKVIAKGEVVVVDENFGLRITNLISPEDRLKSLE